MADKISVDKERELAEFIAGFYADPYGFVMAVFPWGEPQLPDGSFNPLHDKDGPEDWQREELIALGEHIKKNMVLTDLGLDMEVYRLAIASGHGIGKSAFVSWIILFLMSTRVDTRMAVTASTQFQLEDKTWPELSKWHNLMLNKHWFLWSATALSFRRALSGTTSRRSCSRRSRSRPCGSARYLFDRRRFAAPQAQRPAGRRDRSLRPI